MDPLSIIASSIAVIQAATATGGLLRRLATLRSAPSVLHALLNELEATRSFLTILEHSLGRINDSEEYSQAREGLNLLLKPVQQLTLDLEKLIEYRYVFK